MTCLCCDGTLPDPRNFRPADVCDRCLGYLLARIPEHPHYASDEAVAAAAAHQAERWAGTLRILAEYDRTGDLRDPEHREDDQ